MSASLEETEASSAGNVDTLDDDDDDNDDKRQEIWYREDERWELTWPIWHMLSRDEKKTIARKHGYTIGEFEEYMSLQQAVGDTMQQNQKPYENSLIYPVEEEDSSFRKSSRKVEDAKPATQDRQEEDDEDNSELEEEMESEQVAAVDRLPTEELLTVGGQILMLHDELLHRVFDFLPVDQYATLAFVSPHWKSFTRTETVYKRLCERLYLQQSKRRTLHVSRFDNSYRTMLEKRPRVRAGGGAYVIKYSKVKKIQRDMWTEIPVGAILETVYYRYLYFQEDGTVLYALTSAGPHEMFRRLRKANLNHNKDTGEKDAAAVWGKYQVSGKCVTVTARQPWQHVKLELSMQPINIHGRNGYLSFDRHVTSSSDSFNEYDASTVEFEVPEEPFRFVKDRRL